MAPSGGARAENVRRPSQHCTPARSPTSTAKLDELGPSSAVARLWPWPRPDCGRSPELPRTTVPDLAGQHNQPPVTRTLSSGGSRTFLQVDQIILQRSVMPGFCATGRSAKVRFSGAKDTECRDGGRTASTVKMCRPIERETPDAQVVHDGWFILKKGEE